MGPTFSESHGLQHGERRHQVVHWGKAECIRYLVRKHLACTVHKIISLCHTCNIKVCYHVINRHQNNNLLRQLHLLTHAMAIIILLWLQGFSHKNIYSNLNKLSFHISGAYKLSSKLITLCMQ